MSRPGRLQRRPVLLATAATVGVIGGHVLDALGLLPGVHESAEVRAALLGLPEAMAELHAAAKPAGGGGEGEELAALAVAVGLQVVLAAAAVGVAVVLDALLLRLPQWLRASGAAGRPAEA
ncbi:MAG: hypothetical protein JJD92_16400 [Frankiaceae bacterium]|nr:hypothetical protein [Frankiaceae bacterium]